MRQERDAIAPTLARAPRALLRAAAGSPRHWYRSTSKPLAATALSTAEGPTGRSPELRPPGLLRPAGAPGSLMPGIPAHRTQAQSARLKPGAAAARPSASPRCARGSSAARARSLHRASRPVCAACPRTDDLRGPQLGEDAERDVIEVADQVAQTASGIGTSSGNAAPLVGRGTKPEVALRRRQAGQPW